MNNIISGTYINFELAGNGGHIWIYNNEKEIQINRESIEKYEVIDTTSVTITNTTGKTSGTSRKSTSSMAGRAIVGGVLFGPVGAIVGAGTAKSKQKGKTIEASKQTTEREFKVSITFKDGSVVLLQLDEVGYENLLVAVFADPYITYAEYKAKLAEQERIKMEQGKKGLKKFLKYFILPIIYLVFFVHYPVPVFLLSVIGVGWIIYKKIRKKSKTTITTNDVSSSKK